MIRVGLTGNVASGKSTVAESWRDAGIPVVSADALSRQVVLPGSPALREIADSFGSSMVAADGTLDRAALRHVVFGDDEARTRLEAILHPRIGEARDAWMAEQLEAGESLVVAEIPLLYEIGAQAEYDVVVFVDAAEEVRLHRMMEDRGLEEDIARQMMAAQMDPAQKRGQADMIIPNNKGIDELQLEASTRLGDLLRQAGQGDAVPSLLPRWDSSPGDLMRLDLHMHTWGSWDCLSDPERNLEQARARGVERIALTDHNRLHVALRMAEQYPDSIIPGEEVKTAEGIDVIGLYLTEEIPKGTSARETIAEIRRQGGIPYLPHPYASGKGGGGRFAEELGPLVDVIEVFNGRLHPVTLNEKAELLARRYGRLRSAGSDAHTVGEVAGAYIEVPRHENTAAGLRSALRHSIVHGREASRLVHLASTWAKVRKKLPGGRHEPESGSGV